MLNILPPVIYNAFLCASYQDVKKVPMNCSHENYKGLGC